MTNNPTTIRVALDWTPNTIHSGLYLAQHQNLYTQAGLDVQLLRPDTEYSKTPAKSLEAGEADLAICPSESVIAFAESNKPNFHLQAIYAILQRDASAIVTSKDHVRRMRDLEDATYGSYNARYEDHIVRAMVTADGGDASKLKIEGSTRKLSLFEEVKKPSGSVDATWIFLPWEGIEAQMQSCVALNSFRLEEYGVPYGYSPVIARNAASSDLSDDVLSRFTQATRKGYELAVQDPESVVNVLKEHCQPQRSEEFLLQSQREINEYYSESDGGILGSMKAERWQRWLDWLKEKDLVVKEDLGPEELYTNKYLA